MTTEEIQDLVNRVRSMTRDQLDNYVHEEHCNRYGLASANDLMYTGLLEIRWYALKYMALAQAGHSLVARAQVLHELEEAGLRWPYDPQIPPEQRREFRARHPLAV